MTALAPGDVATLFFDYDASTSMTLYGDATNVQQISDGSGGGRHLVAAADTSAPNKVNLNGKDAAQFTPANSDRLRYVGSYTLAKSTGYTFCFVGRLDTLGVSKTILSAIGATMQTTAAGAQFVSQLSLVDINAGVSDGETHLIAASVTATDTTIRIGPFKDTTTGTTSDATNNFAIGAIYSGSGSEFGSITLGRAWAYQKAITEAEFDGLRAWAQSEWGAV